MHRTRQCLLVAAGVLWLAAAGFGFASLMDYAVTPGAAAAAPLDWPAASRIAAPAGDPVLVMAIHPHCPCSRASVIELENLMSAIRGRGVKAYVLVTKPSDFPEDWIRTESVENARRIPAMTVLVDTDGVETARFGANTSGQVVFYDGRGRLAFAGGITRDRGHIGDSPGRRRIVSLVQHGIADAHESLVFGCPLGATLCPLPPGRAGAERIGTRGASN